MNRDTLRPIWGYKWWLALFAIAVGIGTYVISSRQADSYQSTASVQLVSGLQASGQFIDQDTLTELANTYQNLAGTDAVVIRAAQLLGAPGTSPSGLVPTTTTTTTPTLAPGTTVAPSPITGLEKELQSDVSISQEAEVTVLDFVAETGGQRKSQQFAQAYATAFTQYVTDYQNEQRQAALNRIAQQVAQIEVQLNQLPVNLNPLAPENPTRTALTTELQSLEMQASMVQSTPRDTASIVQPASFPTSPSSPSPKRDAALGVLAALLIGVILVYLRVTFTEHYGSAEEAAADLDLPVLAEIPRLGNKVELRTEAFRALRTSLTFALRDQPSMVVLVTSAEANAGKTFVTLNLAVSLALDDRHVLAVDADLRRPMLHQLTDTPATPGLANVLRGRLDELPTTSVVMDAGVSVDITPAGYSRGEMSELLSREKLESVISDVRERYDAVIFDSPPVGAVVDAAIIAGRGTDGVVFVINAHSTRRRDATRAIQTLRALDVSLFGFLFNESSTSPLRYAERYSGARRRGRTR